MWTALLPYGIAILAVVGLWVGHKAQVAYSHHQGYVEGKQEQRKSDEQESANATAAREQFWQSELAAVSAINETEKGKRDASFNELSKRAAKAGGGRVCVSLGINELLGDVTRAANAAGAPAQRETKPDPVPRSTNPETITYYDPAEFSTYIVNAGKAYADAKGQWKACVDAYDRVRGGTTKGN